MLPYVEKDRLEISRCVGVIIEVSVVAIREPLAKTTAETANETEKKSV
jgi:hypothetical protein